MHVGKSSTCNAIKMGNKTGRVAKKNQTTVAAIEIELTSWNG
jgi:GTPase Era involved in 16S rRNA processing